MAQEIWKTFTDITPQSIVAHSQKRGEPSWLTEFRLSALATLNADLVTPYWPIQGFKNQTPIWQSLVKHTLMKRKSFTSN
ncbi:hypothetical protein BXT84_09315 [Sulfobacillus thermotolerans]|uniref:Fe-S cluster assembly protein SufD n=1 Tax=Sulfobacillus thermotolerans TaxID=338644 RepID=A0ABM6RS19_9FIRM|nr:hypothetical protein BXT84_09315 [Sulfobacillus thermotolerans]